MKVVALVQARMGSTRLPNKVMKLIGGIPMIELLLSRLSQSKEVAQIVVATSVDDRNQPLVEHVPCGHARYDNPVGRRASRLTSLTRLGGAC